MINIIYKEKIRTYMIAQNKEKNIIINPTENWKYSIDIRIEPNEKLIYTNLHKTLLWYGKHPELHVRELWTISTIKYKENTKNILSMVNKINIIKITRMSDLDFEIYIDSLYGSDWKYAVEIDELCGFRIIFQKENINALSIKNNKSVEEYIKLLYPTYSEIHKHKINDSFFKIKWNPFISKLIYFRYLFSIIKKYFKS